jgi:phosphate transport system substrate-binding protein
VIRHPDEAALAEAVAADPQAIGVLPFEATGAAQAMALVGRCGLPGSRARRRCGRGTIR